MEVVAEAVSSAGVGSVIVAPAAFFIVTLAVFVVCAVNCSTSVTVALPLPAIAPRLQLMLPAADEHVPWLGVTDTNVAPPVVGQVSERIASGMVEVALLL